MHSTARVVAIGGGGFTHDTDPALVDLVLAACPVARPRIGFIATASDDDAVKIARFHSRFAVADCVPSHLPMTTPLAEARDWMLRQQISDLEAELRASEENMTGSGQGDAGERLRVAQEALASIR